MDTKRNELLQAKEAAIDAYAAAIREEAYAEAALHEAQTRLSCARNKTSVARSELRQADHLLFGHVEKQAKYWEQSGVAEKLAEAERELARLKSQQEV